MAVHKTSNRLCEISGSHGGEYDDSLLDIIPCSFVEVDRRFGGDHRPDDGGSKYLRKVCKLRDYTTLYLKRLSSSPHRLPGKCVTLSGIVSIRCQLFRRSELLLL
jgi:phage gp37-like protein